MQGHKLLHNLIQKSSTPIHKKRISALTAAAGALLIGKRLTLTGIARSSLTKAKERHAIRGMDRLLGNEHLQREQAEIYKILASCLISGRHSIAILVDWSCVNKKKNWYILRASLALKGRSYTIYQEIHPVKKLNSPQAEKPFLKNLKSILPTGIKPVIITDAGFRAPWFKAAEALGFDWIGRVRNKNQYRVKNETAWDYTASLYQQATRKPKIIGDVVLAKSNEIACRLVLVKKRKKNRKHKNRNGNRTNNNASNRCAKRELEPWLLATSLPVDTDKDVIRLIYLYETRMQIEEDFRDTKSHQYGFGLRYSLTNQAKRLEILLLIATLASIVSWLIALSAHRKKLQLDYQSNSIKNRTVLSITYLACQLVRKKIIFTQKELLRSLDELRQMAQIGAMP